MKFGWTLPLEVYLCWAATAVATELHGKIVGTSDGDTVTVLGAEKHQHEIPLAGIDAPEKVQAFAQASKKSLFNMIYGRQDEANWNKHDRYGRVVRKISADKLDVCL